MQNYAGCAAALHLFAHGCVMELWKNQTLCDESNRSILRLLDLGHACCFSNEWDACISSPGYSRLYYIIDGDPYITFNGVDLPLLKNHCYLIPTGASFSHRCYRKMEQVYFHINLLNSNGYDLLRGCKAPISTPIDPTLPQQLCELIAKGGLSSSLLIKSEITRALAHLFSENGISLAAVSHSACVAGAIEYIAKNPTIQLKPSKLAELSFVSLSALSKRFKSEIGKPIGAYIDDIVFFEAEQLLKKGRDEISIQDISQRLGFCDQFYFSRRFKEKYGISPLQYRVTKFI